MWNAFTATLEELHRQYEKIRALQEKKRGILVALDMAALEKLTAEEDFLARAVQELEKQRLTQLAQIAKDTPGVSAETNMEELALLAPTDAVHRSVLAASRSLSLIVKETKELSEANSLLIEGALIAVNRQLGRIGGAVVDPVYGSSGGEQVRHLKKNLDYKA
ncbi:MAG: flagellar protein FlgN [Centipeda sp. (in: firmicutes)]|uniref:flagellar protein FlgN n=1 Tax=Selenomonas sp. oral taxon 920 TaxID=1884263 RepID=UPI0008409AEB|nr:flagellar protein FlgN [Selenomonas sp. oral taxon 920]AOH48749.1 flagellar biosynthesis protein FlgN [Selenomonas sp. oral taxon 920]